MDKLNLHKIAALTRYAVSNGLSNRTVSPIGWRSRRGRVRGRKGREDVNDCDGAITPTVNPIIPGSSAEVHSRDDRQSRKYEIKRLSRPQFQRTFKGRKPRKDAPQRTWPSFEDAFLLQKQLLATRDYAEAVIEAVPPLLVLDEKLRVQTANESFCKCFKISSRQTLNRRVYELGNGQWNIPELRTLLEEGAAAEEFFQRLRSHARV